MSTFIKSITLIIAGTIIFSGCSHSIISSKYENFDFDNHKLLLFQIMSKGITINNKEKTSESSVGNIEYSSKIISDSLYKYISEIATRREKNIKSISQNDLSKIHSLEDTSKYITRLYVDEKSFKHIYYLPAISIIDSLNDKYRFVLVVNKLSVGIELLGQGVHSSYCLVPYFEYVIWDYLNNELVLQGNRSFTISSQAFKIDKNTWQQLFQSVSIQILNDLPFE